MEMWLRLEEREKGDNGRTDLIDQLLGNTEYYQGVLKRYPSFLSGTGVHIHAAAVVSLSRASQLLLNRFGDFLLFSMSSLRDLVIYSKTDVVDRRLENCRYPGVYV